MRSHYKKPGTPDVLPPADAVIAAPLTRNSMAKWAAGISDTLLVEAVGKGLPVVAVPFSKSSPLAQRNAPHMDWGNGVRVVFGVTLACLSGIATLFWTIGLLVYSFSPDIPGRPMAVGFALALRGLLSLAYSGQCSDDTEVQSRLGSMVQGP